MPAPKTSKAELTIRQLRVNLQEIGARECPCGHWNLPQYVCNAQAMGEGGSREDHRQLGAPCE
jgi:ribosomal protein L32